MEATHEKLVDAINNSINLSVLQLRENGQTENFFGDCFGNRKMFCTGYEFFERRLLVKG